MMSLLVSGRFSCVSSGCHGLIVGGGFLGAGVVVYVLSLVKLN